ncbi:hypothetical protein JX265_010979 [Neoarthrinium moseri]|uniref:Fucose-specific lectin n=1 Tax=Neoarthrinium moseri TaxID=1658444 RepID=A0A9P9WD73_9PEZI|nr:hypothetical protein JX266_003207 [Neoarthrinium moseri]KAI1857949.1 hypothetical protein JX265_010979 [Neoarthrinium moseri]
MDGYSNLEVYHNQDPHNAINRFQHGPERNQIADTVPSNQEQKAMMLKPDQSDHAQKEYIPDPTRAPEPVAIQQYYEGSPQNPESLSEIKDDPTEQMVAERRICGLRRRIFFIVLAVISLVIIGVVAGTVGGVLSSRQKPSTSPDPSQPSPDSEPAAVGNLMKMSSLAAANWTDANGVAHRCVFFQDPRNALLARRWDGRNQTWALTNITAVMAYSGQGPPDPAPGTPLAVVSLDRPNPYKVPEAMHLYFVNRQNVMRSLFTNDPLQHPDSWTNDTLIRAVVQVGPGSQLAAAWQRCTGDCKGNMTLAYQVPGGGINVVNSYNWASGQEALTDRQQVAAGTSMALLPQYMGSQEDMGLISQTVDSGTEGTVKITPYKEGWTKDVTDAMSSIPLPANEQRIAATKWGMWSRNLCYIQMSDGTMKGVWWDGSSNASMHQLQKITFDGGPATTNFSAIAFTLDTMFYGITGDEIHEYSVDSSNAAILHHVGRVYP